MIRTHKEYVGMYLSVGDGVYFGLSTVIRHSHISICMGITFYANVY